MEGSTTFMGYVTHVVRSRVARVFYSFNDCQFMSTSVMQNSSFALPPCGLPGYPSRQYRAREQIQSPARLPGFS